jgi:hypothetical protein
MGKPYLLFFSLLSFCCGSCGFRPDANEMMKADAVGESAGDQKRFYTYPDAEAIKYPWTESRVTLYYLPDRKCVEFGGLFRVERAMTELELDIVEELDGARRQRIADELQTIHRLGVGPR